MKGYRESYLTSCWLLYVFKQTHTYFWTYHKLILSNQFEIKLDQIENYRSDIRTWSWKKSSYSKMRIFLSFDWMKMSKCWCCKQNSRWWWWLFINIVDRCVIRVQCLQNQLNGGWVKVYQCKIISGKKPFIARKI